MNTERVVHIDAPPCVVWAVPADVDRWPEWTPTVRRIERDANHPFARSSEARLWLKGLPVSSVWRVTAYNPERHAFTWVSSAPGIHTVAGHTVEADGAGSRDTLTLSQRGIGGMLLRPLIARVSRGNVNLEAESLKRRCEQRATAS